jgi:hypothetical protein
LPAAPQNGVALAHEEAIPHVISLVSLGASRRIVECVEHQLPTPIDHIEEELAALLCLDRSQDMEVSGEVHQPIGAAFRSLNIGNHPGIGIVRGNGEVHDPIDRFKRSGISKARPIGKGASFLNLERCDGHYFSPVGCETSAGASLALESVAVNAGSPR